MKVVSRTNLNDAVEAAVRTMIVDGEMAAGERVNEVHLAAQLGVSRTPLREGLNRLVAEGAIEARPRLGYFVKPLSVEEFEQVYAVRPILDPEALRMAGLPTPDALAALAQLNSRLLRTKDASARAALDDQWHLALIANCPNRVLLAIIQSMMQRAKRYELAWMREDRGVASAGEGHEKILRELQAGRLAPACAALRQNLTGAKPAIVAWLRSRAAIGAKGTP